MGTTGGNNLDESDSNGYALSGKIMLSAIVILFFVVILMVVLHLYARWFVRRQRRRSLRRNRRHGRPHLVFYVDPDTVIGGGAATSAAVAASRGLDSSLLLSLPVFDFSSKTHPEEIECAVCLCDFEEGETGRVLPKCNHSFHIDCIDMWFKTHSTCPLCRSPVEAVPAGEGGNPPEVVITVCEPEATEPGSSSGSCPEEENRVSSPSGSVGVKRKPSSLVGVTVEVPRRNENFMDESNCESPSSFRSPMSRMLSFKRMLSRDWKANLSPSATAAGCSSSAIDLEKEKVGGGDETQ